MSGAANDAGGRPEASGETSVPQLAMVVERLLSQVRGRPVRVTSLRRERSRVGTAVPSDVLRLTLVGGEQVAVFAKYLGTEAAGTAEKKRPDREIHVYEQLLCDADLPVVRYYGSQWNEHSGRHEVFLEYVDDLNLRYQDLKHWFTAARRLGELHVHFVSQPRRLSACDFLLRLDDEYFREWSVRAVSELVDDLPELARRLRGVMDRYDRVIEILMRCPSTLVHNDLTPRNVIAVRSVEPSRICFVDWEMAGIGCGVLDLVDLTAGLDAENAARMCAAYRHAVAGTDLLPQEEADVRALFAACELHRTMYRISFWKPWRVPLARLREWVIEAEHLMASI